MKFKSLPVNLQLSMRDDFIEHFGTLLGQMVTSYAFLNLDSQNCQEELPFKRAWVYRVMHMADKNKVFLVRDQDQGRDKFYA